MSWLKRTLVKKFDCCLVNETSSPSDNRTPFSVECGMSPTTVEFDRCGSSHGGIEIGPETERGGFDQITSSGLIRQGKHVGTR